MNTLDALPKPRRMACLVAWALAIFIPIGTIASIGLPWYQHIDELNGEIQSTSDLTRRYEQLLATIPQLKAELDRERNNQEVKALYFNAPTAALAGAQLQSTIQEMVQAAGARLVNSQFLPAEAKEQPPRVRIRAQIQGDTDALLAVLYHIEQARPFLFVDQLSVRSTTRRNRGDRHPTTGIAQIQTQQELTIRLDVFGYALGEAS